jgi:RNA polymerase-binding transcription factor DksA
MNNSLANDIRKGLEEKRANLDSWLQSTPQTKKQIQLGPTSETALQPCLDVIDVSLEKAEKGTLGICEVCHELVDEGLLLMDYTACVCLSHFTDDERRQLESELELSQVVQRAMLPQSIPSTTGLDIAAFSRPAQIVGGDYFDFLQFNDGALGFVVADVSGHGVSAGMLMTSLRQFTPCCPETIRRLISCRRSTICISITSNSQLSLPSFSPDLIRAPER